MKKSLFAISLLSGMIFFMISSCNKTSGTTDTQAGATVSNISIIAPMSYSPANATVRVGTIVKWTNNDPASDHTVTSTGSGTPSPLNSGSIAPGATFSYTTTATGTFPYFCTVHGVAMSGILTVTP